MGRHATRDEMLDAFGPFSVVFEPIGDDTTPYLSLLHLHDHARVANVVELIRDAACKKGSELSLVALLKDVNWRPQLVGAIANYFQESDLATVHMWRAVDAGSWVTPQLLAILTKVDDDFLQLSLERLSTRCLISHGPNYSVEDPIERHVAQGPAGDQQRSSKAASSLLALLQIDFPSDERFRELRGDSSLQELAAEDVDDSGNIATSWRDRIIKFLRGDE